jgi:Na+-translocating ferredoxin:NAD+ oxidoreductase subunit A
MAAVINNHEILVKEKVSETVTLTTAKDIDIPIKIDRVQKNSDGSTTIITRETLVPADHYVIKDGLKTIDIQPSIFNVLFTLIIGAILINNFVFTRYLGLCVFFGVSQKKATAIGMGITFTIVGVISGTLSWLINNFALVPLQLGFLQIIVFIGVVAALVQAAESIIKKVNPILHKNFGIYLVLITTNCIILAIPLLNASNHYGFFEALSFSLGASLGFALALFLMSCAREKVDLAPIPSVLKGLPIAFILAGLFALAFLGFSGLKFM